MPKSPCQGFDESSNCSPSLATIARIISCAPRLTGLMPRMSTVILLKPFVVCVGRGAYLISDALIGRHVSRDGLHSARCCSQQVVGVEFIGVDGNRESRIGDELRELRLMIVDVLAEICPSRHDDRHFPGSEDI